MERLRQVMLVAGLLAPLATGCAGLHEARHNAMQTLGIEAPAPAVEFQCAWQNRLTQLPDPTKNGANVNGLPGTMLLYTAAMKPAVPGGDLTVIVSDETPRPANQIRKTDQVWHFGPDKLKQMVSVDEMIGKNISLFIPFPADADPRQNWRDVSRVRLKARYDQTIDGKKTTLYAQDTVVTLDFVGSQIQPFSIINGVTRGSVPDPMAVMNQMKQQGQAQAAATWPSGPGLTTPANYTAPATSMPSATQPIWGATPPPSATAPPANPAGGMVVPAVLP